MRPLDAYKARNSDEEKLGTIISSNASELKVARNIALQEQESRDKLMKESHIARGSDKAMD